MQKISKNSTSVPFYSWVSYHYLNRPVYHALIAEARVRRMPLSRRLTRMYHPLLCFLYGCGNPLSCMPTGISHQILNLQRATQLWWRLRGVARHYVSIFLSTLICALLLLVFVLSFSSIVTCSYAYYVAPNALHDP